MKRKTRNIMPTTSGLVSYFSSRLLCAMFQEPCGLLGKVFHHLVTLFFFWLNNYLVGGLMQTIVLGLHSGLKTVEERAMKKKILIDYLLAHFKQHSMYAVRYWFCELLCLINIVGQLYLMNRFTGGEFFSYGWKGELPIWSMSLIFTQMSSLKEGYLTLNFTCIGEWTEFDASFTDF